MFRMVCVEDDKVIMTDPRKFNTWEHAEMALSKRLTADNGEYNWTIAKEI